MTYVHHVPGRLRVRAAGVKGGARPIALKEWLQSLEGVETVEVNPVTGSVLIHYRVGATDGDRLLAMMRVRGWISERPAQTSTPRRSMERELADVVMRQVAEIALERCVLALCAALL